MITAKQAHRSSTKAFEKHTKAMEREFKEIERKKSIEKYRSENEKIASLFEEAQYRIKSAVSIGNFKIELPISDMNIGNRLAKIINNYGYKTIVIHDTIAIGVDEWEDRYFIRISW